MPILITVSTIWGHCRLSKQANREHSLLFVIAKMHHFIVKRFCIICLECIYFVPSKFHVVLIFLLLIIITLGSCVLCRFVYIYFVLSKFYVILNSSLMMINEKSAGYDCLSLLAGISYQINHVNHSC